MSANNWARCPKCIATAKVERARLNREASDSYGVQPFEEFQRLMKEADDYPIPDSWDNEHLRLREDYELGISDDGEFLIHYSASCQRCGFGTDFTHREQLL